VALQATSTYFVSPVAQAALANPEIIKPVNMWCDAVKQSLNQCRHLTAMPNLQVNGGFTTGSCFAAKVGHFSHGSKPQRPHCCFFLYAWAS